MIAATPIGASGLTDGVEIVDAIGLTAEPG
jgi:hypothetical protein